MSIFVSSYEKAIRDAFDSVSNDLPGDHEKLITKISDEICEAVSENIRNRVRDYLMENIKDDICRDAASVAESMLANAMAGDDKQLRNLFGFNEWYMKHLYTGNYPTQYALLDMLIKRHPTLFADERMRQLETLVSEQQKTIDRLTKRLEEA